MAAESKRKAKDEKTAGAKRKSAEDDDSAPKRGKASEEASNAKLSEAAVVKKNDALSTPRKVYTALAVSADWKSRIVVLLCVSCATQKLAEEAIIEWVTEEKREHDSESSEGEAGAEKEEEELTYEAALEVIESWNDSGKFNRRSVSIEKSDFVA
jgi:hypothetical protein